MYLSDKQVAGRFNVSRQTIWRWCRDEGFPEPINLSPGCTRWKLSTVEAWESAKEAAAHRRADLDEWMISKTVVDHSIKRVRS